MAVAGGPRPSFADVVAIDIASGEIEWRFEVEGLRSDHMALSPMAPKWYPLPPAMWSTFWMWKPVKNAVALIP